MPSVVIEPLGNLVLSLGLLLHAFDHRNKICSVRSVISSAYMFGGLVRGG